jgi:hypothetical protein
LLLGVSEVSEGYGKILRSFVKCSVIGLVGQHEIGMCHIELVGHDKGGEAFTELVGIDRREDAPKGVVAGQSSRQFDAFARLRLTSFGIASLARIAKRMERLKSLGKATCMLVMSIFVRYTKIVERGI